MKGKKGWWLIQGTIGREIFDGCIQMSPGGRCCCTFFPSSASLSQLVDNRSPSKANCCIQMVSLEKFKRKRMHFPRHLFSTVLASLQILYQSRTPSKDWLGRCACSFRTIFYLRLWSMMDLLFDLLGLRCWDECRERSQIRQTWLEQQHSNSQRGEHSISPSCKRGWQ